MRACVLCLMSVSRCEGSRTDGFAEVPLRDPTMFCIFRRFANSHTPSTDTHHAFEAIQTSHAELVLSAAPPVRALFFMHGGAPTLRLWICLFLTFFSFGSLHLWRHGDDLFSPIEQ